MNTYNFVHLAFFALEDKVEGKTKLQKTIYFLGILSGYIEDLGYNAHYYGPYSDKVAASVNRLRSFGFLKEDTVDYRAINQEGFEIARHDFSLTEDGKQVAESKSKENPAVYKKIQTAVQKFQDAGNLGYMKLSIAAKTYFILDKKGKPANPRELSEAAKRLGWSPSAGEIEESVSFLEKLDLVTSTSTG